MYIVKNVGQFPVIIRDLNLHIAGGKEVDLDSLYSRDTVVRSVNLERLVQSKKVVVVEQDAVKKKIPSVARQEQKKRGEVDAAILLELKKDILEVKDMLKSGGAQIRHSESIESDLSSEATDKLNKLRVRNLSKEDYSVEKNFETIGQTVEKEEQLNDLLETLDALDKN